jgi:hypothetical protein
MMMMMMMIIIIIIIIIIIFAPTRGFVSLTLNHSGARYPKYKHDWIIIHIEVDDGCLLFLVSPPPHPSYIPSLHAE